MFKFVNPRIESLQLRLSLSEKLNEALIAENKRMEMELEKAQYQVSYLQEKLFDLVGVNKPAITQQVKIGQAPIQIGSKRTLWGNTKQTLEQKSQEEYWLRKKEEANADKEAHINVGELEHQIGIGEANDKIS